MVSVLSLFSWFLPSSIQEFGDFWIDGQKKIKEFYIKTQKEDDVVISASPTFILDKICEILGIKHLLATEVDMKTGKIVGENCYGEEKVRRFYGDGYEEGSIEEFYSDSLSDSPLAEIAKTAYIVQGEKLIPWNEYKK